MIPEFHHDALIYAEHLVRYNFASGLVRGKRVLDLGCGVGYGTDMLKSAGATEVVGIDRSIEAITYGRERHADFQPDYLLADAESLPLRDLQFDVVVSFETLEHVVDYRHMLAEAKRVMRPGGLLILSTPNKGVYSEGNPYHTKEFTFTELEEELTTRFEHVGIFPQDNWITSAILSPSTMERADQPIGGNAKIFKTVGRPAGKTLYIVALCSDAPLPKVSQQVAMADIAEMERLAAEIGRLRADVPLLSSDIAERDAAVAERDALLAEKDAALADKDAALAEKDAALAEKDTALAKTEAALARRQEALEQTTQELITIRQSLGYRILEGYRRPIRWLFPQDSWRSLPYRALWRTVRGLLDFSRHPASVIHRAVKARRTYGTKGLIRRLFNRILKRKRPFVTAATPEDIRQWFLKNRKKVTVIIPVYNDCKLTKDCVESITKLPSAKFVDIVVVDDGSSEQIQNKLTALNLPVKLILKKKNSGFASACNTGIAAAINGDIVLLNNDTIVHDGWIEALQYYTYLREDIGITGPKLLYPDGTIQWAGSHRNTGAPEWFDHNFRFKPHDYGPANVPVEVLAATGACMYIRRDVLSAIGTLDARFEMGFEDVDYSLRAWNAGFSVSYVPASVVTHFESKTRGMKQGEREIRSLRHFWEKWGGWFDGRKVTNDQGKLRIIYVMLDTGLAGGHRVIFEHVNGLIEAGCEVILYATSPAPSWFPLKVPVKTFTSYHLLEDDLREQEAIKVATWWETAPSVWRSSITKGIPVYLVQDIETSYYADSDPARHEVIAWYKKEFNYLTTSTWNRNQLAELGLGAKIVAPGVDLSTFREKGLKRESNTLLAVGRSHPLKNLDLTIEAWNKLNERSKLVLFGVEPSLGKEIGADYIVAPDDEKIANLYNEATVFIQTSRHEGFCLTVLEAMACGAPVICTDADGNMDFCVHGENCLIVEQDNVQQLAEAIRKLCSDGELQRSLSKAGLETAAAYDWKEKIKELEQFLYSLGVAPIGKRWEVLAKFDAKWAILADPEKLGNKWDEKEFFATGQEEIEELMRYVEGLPVTAGRDRALDFGCGVGRRTQPLAKWYSRVDGLDISPTMIESAQGYNELGDRVVYRVNDGTRLPFEDHTFDLVNSYIVLQHMEKKHALEYIREFLRAMKPGGLTIFQAASLPLTGEGDRFETVIATLEGTAMMDMNVLSVEEAVLAVESAGGFVVDILRDFAAGSGFLSFQYCCSKQ